MHKATQRFWDCFDQLPPGVQMLARKNFDLLKQNPHHPSLRFKRIDKFWSIRVGKHYRALAVRDGDDFTWVWIGTHSDYDQMLKS